MYSSIFSMCVQIDVFHCVKSAKDFSYLESPLFLEVFYFFFFPKVKFSSYLFYLYIHLFLSCPHTHSHTHPKTYTEICFRSILFQIFCIDQCFLSWFSFQSPNYQEESSSTFPVFVSCLANQFLTLVQRMREQLGCH